MADESVKAYTLGIRYLASRARSILEMKQYLNKKKISPDAAAQAVERLRKHNYLDDRSFAAQFVQNRIRFKPKSLFALGYELRAKGIDPCIIEDLLQGYEDMDLALKAVQPKLDAWQHLSSEKLKKKMMNYLGYRGFDHGTCISVLEKISSKWGN